MQNIKPLQENKKIMSNKEAMEELERYNPKEEPKNLETELNNKLKEEPKEIPEQNLEKELNNDLKEPTLRDIFITISRCAYVAPEEYVFAVWADNVSFLKFLRKANHMEGHWARSVSKLNIVSWYRYYKRLKKFAKDNISEMGLYNLIKTVLNKYEKHCYYG